jgi:very-short-patch-repair endonuclease
MRDATSAVPPWKNGEFAHDSARGLSVRLFRFLSEFTSLKTKRLKDTAAFPAVFWFKDLPREKEIHTQAWGLLKEEEPWLSVDKPRKPILPQPPQICLNWYDPNGMEDISSEPQLRSTLEDKADEIAASPQVGNGQTRMADAPQVQAAWASYLSNKWRPWKQEVQRWESVQKCYRGLFAILQEQERRGEQYELLVGIGTLLWVDPSGRRVCRPILTARATLSLADGGRIELNPPDDGAEVCLEQDMLDPDQQPPADRQAVIEERVRSLEWIWDRAAVLSILEDWFDYLPVAADSHVSDTLDFTSGASAVPQMALAPVLILRERRSHCILTALKQAEESLRNGVAVPRGIRAICGEYEVESASRESADHGIESVPNEALFPLPANVEQQAILDRLGTRSGVLVQGPPGTGKSHTIINLICHFMAQGKRVLVTSQTPRALRVLQDKFPREILPLVVSLLDEKPESRESLERSVRGILQAIDDPARDPRSLERRIGETWKRRLDLQAELANLLRLQRETREADTCRHKIQGLPYHGTAQQIAMAIESDAPRFDWLCDNAGENAALPLSSIELAELCEELKQLGPQADELARSDFVDPGCLPLPQEFERAVRDWQAAEKESARFTDSRELALWLGSKPVSDLRIFHKLLQQWLLDYGEFAARGDWTTTALRDLAAGRTANWQLLARQTDEAIANIRSSFNPLFEPLIEGARDCSDVQLLADGEDLQRHLKSGGRLGVWLFRDRVVRRTRHLWSCVRVDGRLCHDLSTLEKLTTTLRNRNCLEKIQSDWPIDAHCLSGSLGHRLARLEENLGLLRRLLNWNAIGQKASAYLSNYPNGLPALTSVASMQFLVGSCDAALAVHRAREAEAYLNELASRIDRATASAAAHKTVTRLRQAAQQRDGDAYRHAFDDCAAGFPRHVMACRACALRDRLAAAAPNLASSILEPSIRDVLGPRLHEFEAAWSHGRARAWLERYEAEHSNDDLERRLKKTEAELLGLTARWIADKCWLACLLALRDKPDRQGAMKAWEKTVVKIGCGKGKQVETLRRAARKFLQQCWDAIPAHVMPLYRVAEQFRFDEPEVFDVVIVDEASQTGPEGLLLGFLAKQCIVVGDDKQISPEEGFVDADAARMLIAKHIPDLPFADTLRVGTSLFEQAEIRYQRRLSLREHFRCMPEIIRFSNDLCYRNAPLIPLRQYSADRLVPLVDRFVTDGFREGADSKVINRPEAAAVAKSIVECLEDPRYSGKSFGVICLLGHAQEKLIQQMILDRVGPEPFRDATRRLLCGDPYSFQGDERDIIFLSMVVALNAPFTALTSKKYLQRFNVAASRARDQMWVFHSVREGELNPSCVRRGLLLHMSNNPEMQAPTVDLASVRGQALHARREPGNQPAPFDSWFEVDVFLTLIDRGFRVLPQYPVAGKRIDLVVEDAERRLALECDGDEWHGPETFEADCQRQRVLERCGWQFVRLRGSSFYAQRPKAVDRLVAEITRCGVGTWSCATATSHALDTGEISGRGCLRWLGEPEDQNAKSGPESGWALGDQSTDLSTSEDGRAFDAQQCQLVSDDTSESSRTETRSSSSSLSAPEFSSPTLVDEKCESVIACLREANGSLTAGQLCWRTKLSDVAWPDAERELLRRKILRKDGAGRKARYHLVDERGTSPSAVVPTSSPGAMAGDNDLGGVSAETWFAIAHWARRENMLEPWQRGLAYSLGKRKRSDYPPTEKQLRHGLRILAESRRLGFTEEQAQK